MLARIETPCYHTSKKGISYIDNAKMHRQSKNLIKTDISKFYPSTTLQMIYDMFVDVFLCSRDIAFMLAKICCFNKHLPTGSPLSGYVAFFTAKKMFDEIEQLTFSNNCILSVYVDDITVSGDSATKKLLWEIQNIIKKYGYVACRRKSKFYHTTKPKSVTGVIIRETYLLLPNKRHKKIWETTKEYHQLQDDKQKQFTKNKLDGMVREAKKITQLTNK